MPTVVVHGTHDKSIPIASVKMAVQVAALATCFVEVFGQLVA